MVASRVANSGQLNAFHRDPNVIRQLVPLDFPPFVHLFLGYWSPWILEAAARPVLGINAPTKSELGIYLSEGSHARWRYAPRSAQAFLALFDLCLTKSQIDAERFAALGARHAVTTDNAKLDVFPSPVNAKELVKIRPAVLNAF